MSSRRRDVRGGQPHIQPSSGGGEPVEDLQPISGSELLRRYRASAGLTQEELAERAGLSARAIRALEAGTRRLPHRDTLSLLASALELSPSERRQLELSIRQQRRSSTPVPRAFPARRTRLSLVGRHDELALLATSLRDDARPLSLLAGEPGIGKSHLLEAAAELASTLGWTIVSGGCHRHSARQPYAPLVEALAHFLASRTLAQQRHDTQGCAWLIRLLPELAQRTLVPSPTWTLPPEQERRLMFMAVARFLENVGGPAGTLLVLDDLHWAGTDALDLLAFLVRETRGQRVRIIGAYRDTDVSPADPLALLLADLARDEMLTWAPLGPLAGNEAAQLLVELFAGSDAAVVTPDEQALILSRAGGVPFFLVCCAQEARVRSHGRPGGRADGAFAGPWTAAQSIRQRVALLDESASDILAIAAVAERAVPRPALLLVAEGLGQSEHETLKALELTTRSRLLVERADGTYAFAHDLIRETLSAEVSGARRATLHRRLGAALGELHPGDDRAAELAWHFALGDDLARAIPQALRAGDHAEAVYAHAEAERHYRAAAEWARTIGDRAHEGEALEKLADVVFRLAHYREAYDCLERAITIYRSSESWERLAWATCQIARAGEPLRKTEASLRRLDQLFTLLASVATRHEGGADTTVAGAGPPETMLSRAARADAVVTPKTSARLYLCLTTRHLFLGHYRDVFEPSERAVHYARLAGDLRIESLAYSFRAEAQLAQGQVSAAAASLALGRERAEASGDVEALYIALEGIVNVHESQARPSEARAVLEQMLEVSRRLGDVGYVGDTLCALGAFSFLLGEWDQARSYLLEARDSVRHSEFNRSRTPATVLALLELMPSERDASDDTNSREAGAAENVWIWTRALLAERDILASRAASAAAGLRETIHRLEAEPGSKCYLLAPLAWAESELGERENAIALLAEARQVAEALGNRMVLVDIERVEALLALQACRWEDARQALDRSLEICRAMPYPYAEAKALLVYGDLCAATSGWAQARSHYAQALGICERLGERLYHAHIQMAIRKMPGDERA